MGHAANTSSERVMADAHSVCGKPSPTFLWPGRTARLLPAVREGRCQRLAALVTREIDTLGGGDVPVNVDRVWVVLCGRERKGWLIARCCDEHKMHPWGPIPGRKSKGSFCGRDTTTCCRNFSVALCFETTMSIWKRERSNSATMYVHLGAYIWSLKQPQFKP